MIIEFLKSQNLILFEVISGSKSFGLNTLTSDTDIKGVYYLPKEKFFGLDYIPQISNETNDEVYYEIGRFVELLLKNNPNILEILASPEDCILYKHPLMEHLQLEDFLSKLCKDSFAGYAVTQIKKARGLNKKIVNPMSKYCKEYTEYWNWIEKRNEDRYDTNQKHGKNYDSKNMMHTIRLLQTAEQILSTGKLNIRVSNREELLDIKAGNKEYDDLLEMADNLIASIENNYETSTLPEKPNEEEVLKTLIKIREELYR